MRDRTRLVRLERPHNIESLGKNVNDAIGGTEKQVIRTCAKAASIALILQYLSANLERRNARDEIRVAYIEDGSILTLRQLDL